MIYSSAITSPPGRTAASSERDRLVARVLELAPSVRRAFDVRRDLQDRATWQSLTLHQLEALDALADAPLTMRALCERLDISESAGSALCDRLVGRDMVTRQLDHQDRRVVRVALTDEARAMVARFRSVKQARIAELLSVLDRDALATLARIYETLLAASQRAPKTAP